MKIAICDDSEKSAKMLKEIILECSEEKIDLLTFFSGKDLLEEIEEVDAVFLDVEMPEMDGYEVGKEINKRNPNCQIIMATGNMDRFQESFYIKAIRYVRKPFQKKEVAEALSAIGKEEITRVFLERIEYTIRQRDIRYIEAYNGYVLIHIENKIYRKEVSLKKYMEILSTKYILQVSQSVAVGLKFISDITDKEVVLKDKKFKIPVRRREEIRKKYFIYITR